MTQARLVGNRYEVGELIGYGGMAEVHRGRDARLGRDVAVKVLRSDLARDPLFLARFRREAQSAAGLNHPAIVSVYDTGEDAGPDGAIPYIVMEYVEGRTLRDVLRQDGPLPPKDAMQIMADVCGALEFSHRHGIVHRDIKPANVMIQPNGEVKVMDFGIARAVADSASTVTQTAAVIGTAQYLSPEQARGEMVDARSDVYSCGCLLYELLTGVPPFQGDSPVAVAYQHVREVASIPSSRNPAIPRPVDSIVMKALAKNPHNRYQSAAEMRADLQRAIADLPVEAESVLTDEERTQFIAPVGGPPTGRRPDAYDPGDDGRRRSWFWIGVVVVLLLLIGAAAYAIVLVKQSGPEKVTVPNLIGKNADAANSALVQAGFPPVTGPANHGSPCGADPTNAPSVVAPGDVCTQSVAPGSSVAKGDTITFTLYQIDKVQVPSELQKQVQDASTDLQNNKLLPVIQQIDDPSPAGTVVKQDPQPFTSVPINTQVTLYVSTGKVAIPDERGKAVTDARADLNNNGWSNIVVAPLATADPAQDGKVLAMDPTPGSKFPQSQKITLTVGQYTPPPPTTTPSCTPTPTPTRSRAGSTPTPTATATTTTPAPGSTATPTC